ncbi:MAG: endonuclease [Elusimicrobiota bacterium]
MAKARKKNRYEAIIERIFFRHYKKGARRFPFARKEIESTAAKLRIALPKNIGDLLYSFRYRTALPTSILATAAPGYAWNIESTGKSSYIFQLEKISRILPRPELITIKIPDATPELVASHAQGDEQALLAKVRYNRLVDVFFGLTTYSLQNHLRTTVKGIGQIEIDELYVGLDRHGNQYVIPVQAKGGKDQLSPVQTKQDLACCKEKFPSLTCRALSAQFMADDLIAMFELTIQDGAVRVVDEKHYKLVPAKDITPEDLASYRQL